MTKAELVVQISKRTGIERSVVLATVEAFMDEVKNNLGSGTTCICAASAASW